MSAVYIWVKAELDGSNNDKMKKLYVFGNEYLEGDNFALKISKSLKSHEIVYCTSPDDLLSADEKEIVILDVVKGIKKTILIEDIKQISTRKIISLHDFDVGFFLSLMQGMGINKKIKIIGVPQQGNEKKTANEVAALL